jgi:drug/metabolite transporter (DMT)-like permease
MASPLHALIGVMAFSFRPILIKLAYAVPTAAAHPLRPTTLLFLRMVVSVAITSALGLDEPFAWLQAAGGALAISAVLLVSLKPVSLKPTGS